MATSVWKRMGNWFTRCKHKRRVTENRGDSIQIYSPNIERLKTHPLYSTYFWGNTSYTANYRTPNIVADFKCLDCGFISLEYTKAKAEGEKLVGRMIEEANRAIQDIGASRAGV